MTETGEVVKIEKDDAVVRFDRKEACGRCGMCAFKRETASVEMRVPNALGAAVGENVDVELTDGLVLAAAVIVYVLPLLFAGLGLGLGFLLHNEIGQLFLCLGFLVVGYIIVILLDRKLRLTRKAIPVMVKRRGESGENKTAETESRTESDGQDE